MRRSRSSIQRRAKVLFSGPALAPARAAAGDAPLRPGHPLSWNALVAARCGTAWLAGLSSSGSGRFTMRSS